MPVLGGQWWYVKYNGELWYECTHAFLLRYLIAQIWSIPPFRRRRPRRRERVSRSTRAVIRGCAADVPDPRLVWYEYAGGKTGGSRAWF